MAPMADVTDAAFRQIIAKYGKPDVLFTEFVSCDGLCSVARTKLLRDLIYHESERPVVAQIWGTKPVTFTESAALIRSLGFDGIDINMGCPDRTVCRHGGGAALIDNPDLAKKIIRATKKGAGGLPVSIKTRLGYHTSTIDSWMAHLLETEPAAITVHVRTKKELSKVEARWDEIRIPVRMAENTDTLIIGNGDIQDIDEARKIAAATGVDGVMLGRAIFGNPWLFNPDVKLREISFDEKMNVLIEHAQLFEEIFQGQKNFAILRKHFKAYITGFPGAKELRMKLEHVRNAAELKNIIDDRTQYQARDFTPLEED